MELSRHKILLVSTVWMAILGFLFLYLERGLGAELFTVEFLNFFLVGTIIGVLIDVTFGYGLGLWEYPPIEGKPSYYLYCAFYYGFFAMFTTSLWFMLEGAGMSFIGALLAVTAVGLALIELPNENLKMWQFKRALAYWPVRAFFWCLLVFFYSPLMLRSIIEFVVVRT